MRTNIKGKTLLTAFASSAVLPGIVMGLAVDELTNRLKIGLYGTIWAYILAYIPLIIPYALRYMSPRCCRSARRSRSRRG